MSDSIEFISDLKPDPNNARKRTARSRSMLVESLKEMGAARSIVIDEKGCILAGNGTIEAATIAGIQKVKVVEADGETIIAVRRTGLTDDEKKRLSLFDNRTAELAEWDADVLAELSQEVDLSGFFTNDELANLIPTAEPPTAEEDEETTADLMEQADAGAIESRVSLGQIWQIGRHRICCGDSTDEGNVKKLLGDRVCEICFTSPPYNLGSSVGLRNGAFKGKKSAYNYEDNISSQSYLDLLNGFLECAFIASRYQFVNIQSLSANKFDLFAWVGNHSDHLSDVLIWSKTNPQPAMAEKVCNSAFEFVFVFSSELKPNRAIESAIFPRGTFSNVYSSSVGSNSHTDGSHGATFPVEFAQHYLGAYTNCSSLIYEPFLGSGTTIIAAQKMEGDRTVYGFELSPDYVEVCLRRFEAFTGQTAELVGTL